MKNICILFESHKRTISFRSQSRLIHRDFFLKIPKGAYHLLVDKYEFGYQIEDLKVCLFTTDKKNRDMVLPCMIGNIHSDFAVCASDSDCEGTSELKCLIEDTITNYWQSYFTDDISLFGSNDINYQYDTVAYEQTKQDHVDFLIEWEEITKKDGDVMKFIENTKFRESYKPKRLKRVLEFPDTIPITFESLKQFQDKHNELQSA